MDRRKQLLDTALELIDRNGVRGTSMRELARRAGVDVRSVYYHFESKRDLLRSLFEQAGMLAPLRDPIPQEILAALRRVRPEDALVLIIEGNLQMLQEGAPYSRLIHVEVLHDDEDAKAVGHEMWNGWGDQLVALLRAGRLAGDQDAIERARTLRSLLWGVFNESQLTGELEDAAKRHARAEEIARLFLPGLRARRRVSPTKR